MEKVENFGFPKEFVRESIKKNEMNHGTCCYYLLMNKKDSKINAKELGKEI